MEVLSGLICRVKLPNGHIILAHRSRRLRASAVRLDPGDRVTVQMTPFDMSRGRIADKIY